MHGTGETGSGRVLAEALRDMHRRSPRLLVLIKSPSPSKRGIPSALAVAAKVPGARIVICGTLL